MEEWKMFNTQNFRKPEGFWRLQCHWYWAKTILFLYDFDFNKSGDATHYMQKPFDTSSALAPYMPTIEHIFIHTYTIVIYFYTSNIHILLFFCRLFRFIVAPKGVRWFVVVLLSLASFCIYYTSNLHLQLTTIANKEKIIYLAWVLFPTFCCCWWYCCCFHTIIMIFLLRLCSVCIFNSFHFDLYYIFRILLGVFSDYRWSFVLWKKISNGEFHSEK